TFVPEKASLAWSCYGFIGAQQEGKQVYYLYVTPLFRTPGSMKEALTTAWRAKLRELHPGYYPNPEGCQLLPPDPADQPARITQLAQQFKAQNPEVVHLDWAYHAESVAAANADTLPGYYCQMISADTKTWYVSPVNRLEGVYNGPAYYTSWNAFIKTVPGFNPGMFHGGCESGPMKNEREGRGSRKEQIAGQAGGKVYEVDWKYTPSASPAASSVAASAPAPAAAAAHAAPAASAPAAAAAPIRAAAPAAPPVASHPFYCRYLPRPEAVNAHQTMYQTDVFTYAGTITAVSQGWQKHVEETYHTQEKGRAPCLMLPPTPEQQQRLIQSIDRGMESSRISVVKDGWRP
ncbi:MAG TPA: hypothetical protein VJN62_09425, partial [Gemmatimonadales bacterium]|nr:hypothetical protein [Gemmatimonadales bacterium]